MAKDWIAGTVPSASISESQQESAYQASAGQQRHSSGVCISSADHESSACEQGERAPADSCTSPDSSYQDALEVQVVVQAGIATPQPDGDQDGVSMETAAEQYACTAANRTADNSIEAEAPSNAQQAVSEGLIAASGPPAAAVPAGTSLAAQPAAIAPNHRKEASCHAQLQVAEPPDTSVSTAQAARLSLSNLAEAEPEEAAPSCRNACEAHAAKHMQPMSLAPLQDEGPPLSYAAQAVEQAMQLLGNSAEAEVELMHPICAADTAGNDMEAGLSLTDLFGAVPHEADVQCKLSCPDTALCNEGGSDQDAAAVEQGLLLLGNAAEQEAAMPAEEPPHAGPLPGSGILPTCGSPKQSHSVSEASEGGGADVGHENGSCAGNTGGQCNIARSPEEHLSDLAACGSPARQKDHSESSEHTAAQGMAAAVAQGPGKSLPEGFRFRKVCSASRPSGRGEHIAECPVHGKVKRLDRWSEIVIFFDMHAQCR